MKRTRPCFTAQQNSLGHGQGKERTGMSQRPPQPARDVKVQRRPELRLKRLLKPPATCGTRLAQLAESSIVLPHVNIQCAPADCPQQKGLCPAPVPVAHCSMSWRAHACRTCTCWPAFIHCRTHPLHCEAQRRPTQFLVRYLCRKLVQAHSPWPGGHTGAGHVRTHAALRRMLLNGLQAAVLRLKLWQGWISTPLWLK